MKRYAILLCALLALPAFAGRVAHSGENSARLMDAPCTHPGIMLAIQSDPRMADKYKDKFRAAQIVQDGELYSACWIEDNGAVLLMVESVDANVLPSDAFKDEASE